MVDFQSRDTRRGTDDEEEDEEPPAEKPEVSETQGVDTDGTDTSTPDTEGQVHETEELVDTFTYAVVTVADGQTLEEDATGDAVEEAVEQAGDTVVTRELLSPSYDGVQQSLTTLSGRRDVDAIVTLGGTGVEPDDVTVDAATHLFDKRLPGFGELFRVLSHDHEGTAVVRTRTTAGLIDGVPVFCLPGESSAARRGIEQIVLAEAPELVELADEGEDDEA